MPLFAILLHHPAMLSSASQPTLRLATFGVGDTLLIVVIALIVFGPKRLPEISRQVGKLLYEFRKASNDFKFQIEEELRVAEQAERQKQLQAAAIPQPATPVAMSSDAQVSAAPLEAGTPDPAPSIQPPSSGTPVSSRPPYRSAEVDALNAAATGPMEELEANAQAAMQAAAAERAAQQRAHDTAAGTEREEGAASRPVPTHHG